MNRSFEAVTNEGLCAHLAAIVEHCADAIMSVDLLGVITSWNAAATELYGYTAEEAVGSPASMLLPAKQANELAPVMERLRRGERAAHYEAIRQAKDGRELHLSLTVSLIRDQGGQVTGASVVGRDISERKAADRTAAQELRAHKRLHEISSRLIPADDVQPLFKELIDAAIAITEAERGTMQILNRETGELRLLEARGMPPEVWSRYGEVGPGMRTSCSEALRAGERVLIDYVTEERVAGTVDARVHLDAGIRAAQSTPLVTRSGQMVGMISTHWSYAPRLSEAQRRLLDILSRQATDLIERTDAVAALRESARRERERADELETLIDSVPAVVFLAHDPRCRRITGNRKAHELLGVPLEGNLSRTAPEAERPEHFYVFMGGVAVDPEELPVQRAARGEPMYDQELEVRFADGGVRYLFGNAVPTRDEHGKVRGAIAALIDVTDRKEAERALLLSEERLRLAKGAAGIGIHDFSVATGSIGWDERTREIWGVDPDEPITYKLWLDGVHPDDRELAKAAVRRALDPAGDGVYLAEFRVIHRKDGVTRWVQVTGDTTFSGGEPVRLVGTVHEITDRKEAEQALERKALELERSNRDLEHFAYMASHDLQQPLRIVLRFSELLQRRYAGRLDPQADELIGFIADGAARMQKLIRDLLRFARVQARDVQPKPVDAAAVVDAVCADLRFAIEEAGGRVERSALPEVYADRDLLAQVFHNLIGNAIKFRGEAPPRVEVTAAPQGAGFTFAVRDNGIGFAEGDAARIFEAFQRLHGPGEYPGTGLGLALSKRLVERLGGRIWAEASPGEGATFLVHLPACQPEADARQARRHRGPHAATAVQWASLTD